jgi:hypothetical protein
VLDQHIATALDVAAPMLLGTSAVTRLQQIDQDPMFVRRAALGVVVVPQVCLVEKRQLQDLREAALERSAPDRRRPDAARRRARSRRSTLTIAAFRLVAQRQIAAGVAMPVYSASPAARR